MARETWFNEYRVLRTFFDNPDYLAYPARLEKEYTTIRDRTTGEKHIYLNRVTAKAICEKYEKIGALTHKMGPTFRRRENSKYYHANEDREAFISFCTWIYEKKGVMRFGLPLGTQYSKLVLNRQFVVDVLKERGVVLKVPAMIFPPRPGEDLSRKGVITPSLDCVWSLPVLGRYSKIYEHDWEVRREIPNHHHMFYYPRNIGGKKGYIDEDDIRRFYNKVLKKPQMYFPLRIESERSKVELTEDDLAKIRQMNPGKLEDENYGLVLQGYYENYQEEHVILPILCLIRNSPSALFEFLFTDWTKDRQGTVHSGNLIEPIEAVLFRMVFKTISDILDEMSMFDSDSTSSDQAYFGTAERYGRVNTSLLTLKLRDGRLLIYEGGFTTDITWIALNDADVIPLITNRENSRIKTMMVGERYEPPIWSYSDESADSEEAD